MRFVEEFFAYGIILRECNSLFIVLIPKVENAQWLGDYRPISLVGCMHKIVAKLLANRTKKVLPRVIDKKKKNKSAFLSGRHLLHSVIVTYEVVDEAKRKKKQGLLFKVNFEKAKIEFLGQVDTLDHGIPCFKLCICDSQ